MRPFAFYVAVLLVTLSSVVVNSAENTAPDQRMVQLMGELLEAQRAGNHARVAELEAQIRTLKPQVQEQQRQREQAPTGQANIVEKMRAMEAQRQEAQQSPDIQISLAARAGDLAKVKQQLLAGANLNPVRLDPGPPLMEAAIKGYIEIAKYLLDNGAKLRISQGIFSLDALRLAAEAKEDNSAMIRLLVERGALNLGDIQNLGSVALKAEENKGREHKDVRAHQITSGGALTAAVEKERVQHVRTLLSLGVPPDAWANNQTALIIAAKRLNIAIATELLKAGANPNLKTQAQKTALKLVLEKPQTEKNRVQRQAMLDVLRAHGGTE